MPIDHYSNGVYSGMLFLKFESQKDRDCALGLLNKMDKVGELANMWSKADRPIETRAVQQATFGAKWLLRQWGYLKDAMWADEDAGVLWIGQDQVLRSFVTSNGLDIEYGDGWEDYLKSDEWTTIVKQATEKVGRKQMAKGKGKGKTKDKNK